VVKTPATTTCLATTLFNPFKKENKDAEEDALRDDPGDEDAEVARL